MPAIVTKFHDSRSGYVRVFPRGPVCRRHNEQLRPNYGVEEVLDPGQVSESMVAQENLWPGETPKELGKSQVKEPEPRTDLEDEMHQPDTGGRSGRKLNPRLQVGNEYGPHNFRTSKRLLTWYKYSTCQRTSRLVGRCYGVISFPTLSG